MLNNILALGYAAQDLIPASLTEQISNFAADLQLTTVNLAILIVPLGLGIWAIGFGIKKGIGALKGIANRVKVG